MSEKNVPPAFLIVVLVLDGSLGNLFEISLPFRVAVEQLHLLIDHTLQISNVCFPLLSLNLHLFRQLTVNLDGSVF
jgi:hypothetical protein